MRLLLQKISSSTAWLMLPTLLVASLTGLVVAGYNPLTFDPALVQQAQAAQSAQLKMHDAEEEATGTTIAAAGTPASTEAVPAAAAPQAEGLADGTWTGYAACGQGNEDGWNPYYVAVTIEVTGGKVTRIVDIQGTSTADSGSSLYWNPSENQSYLAWAISGKDGQAGVMGQINSVLSAGSMPSGIDTVSGATFSSVAIYNAFAAAVNKSAQAGGGSQIKQADAAAKGGKKSKSGKPSKKKKVSDTSSQAEVASKSLADGSWIGYAACGVGNDEEWSPYYVSVVVTVKNGKVVSVGSATGSSAGEAGSKALNWNEAENQAYLNWAASGRTRGGVAYVGVLDQINKSVKGGSYPGGVDVVSGATYSSQAIFEAFYAALKKSAAAGGATVTEPGKGGSTSKDDQDKPKDSDAGDKTDDPVPPSGGSQDGNTDDPNPDPGAEPEPVILLVDGTYSGYAFCKDLDDPRAYSPYYIIVDIEVADGRVAKITDAYGDERGVIDARYRYDSTENDTYLKFAVNGVGTRVKGMVAKIQAKLDAGEDPSDVDVVSSATWSSKAILEAFNSAVASVPQR